MNIRIPSQILLFLPFFALADFESASQSYQNQDYRAAFEEFSTLAEAGDARSQTVLAIMYKYGESVPVDASKAYEWYLKAAEQGYPPAQYNVGAMLADGNGVDPDPKQASQWLQRAADAGFERALDKLAEIRGDVYLASLSSEPIPWSQNWNLRLPNQIRFEETDIVDTSLQVFRIQLGAMGSMESARNLWGLVVQNNENLLKDYQPIFRPGTSQGKAVWRVQIGPFSDQQSAQRVCNVYLEQPGSRTGCLVIQTD